MLSIKAVCKSENNEEVTIIGFELQGYCLCMTKSGTIFHAKHEDLTIVDKEYMESCAKESIDFKMADFLEKASARLDRIQSKQLTSIILEVQEYRSKIEQGTLIASKFARNQEVYYIEYVMHAYPCPHCGEECYEEKVKGVAKGVICERIITDNQDGMDIVYTIQIEEKGKLKMFTKREEKEIFLTREEAEKRLKKLQNG